MNAGRLTLHRHYRHRGWLIGDTGILTQRIPDGPYAGQWKVRGDNLATHSWLVERGLTAARFDSRHQVQKTISAVLEQDPIEQVASGAPRLRQNGTWVTADGRWRIRRQTPGYIVHPLLANGLPDLRNPVTFPRNTPLRAIARRLALLDDPAH